MERESPNIKVQPQKIALEEFPEVTVFTVELSSETGSWLETFGTELELRAFLRGLQAGSQMTGGPYLNVPLEF